jgi:hypothetical protein
MGETVRHEMYTALPLAMSGNSPRDPTAFAQYMPGVTGFGSDTAGNVYDAQGNSQDVYIEGLPITNPVLEGENRNLALSVSVEAVDQFQVETAGTPAMHQGQGSTNFVIQSGTNNLYGAAYDYFRNTISTRAAFFASVTPVEHTNQFGFDMGGPIKRNRLFLFGNYDGYRVVLGGQPSFYSLPTHRRFQCPRRAHLRFRQHQLLQRSLHASAVSREYDSGESHLGGVEVFQRAAGHADERQHPE